MRFVNPLFLFLFSVVGLSLQMIRVTALALLLNIMITKCVLFHALLGRCENFAIQSVEQWLLAKSLVVLFCSASSLELVCYLNVLPLVLM